eukprot:5836625-Prorocentrum_lima.AAC.1
MLAEPLRFDGTIQRFAPLALCVGRTTLLLSRTAVVLRTAGLLGWATVVLAGPCWRDGGK